MRLGRQRQFQHLSVFEDRAHSAVVGLQQGRFSLHLHTFGHLPDGHTEIQRGGLGHIELYFLQHLFLEIRRRDLNVVITGIQRARGEIPSAICRKFSRYSCVGIDDLDRSAGNGRPSRVRHFP